MNTQVRSWLSVGNTKTHSRLKLIHPSFSSVPYSSQLWRSGLLPYHEAERPSERSVWMLVATAKGILALWLCVTGESMIVPDEIASIITKHHSPRNVCLRWLALFWPNPAALDEKKKRKSALQVLFSAERMTKKKYTMQHWINRFCGCLALFRPFDILCLKKGLFTASEWIRCCSIVL